jgi:hypothetical protein
VLSVLNSGYGDAKNITVSLLSDKNFTALGSTQFRIGALAQGGASAITAEYQTNSSIASGTYALPLRVTYYSETGQEYNETVYQQVGVLVDNPNIVVNITSAQPSALYRGYNQTLEISITNIGTGTAKNVSVRLSPSSGISILSSVKSFFIGSLAPGQSAAKQVLVSSGNYTSANASISANMTYYTQNYRNRLEKVSVLGLSVAQASMFTISQGAYTLVPGSTDMNVSYVLTNTGNVNATDLQLSFQSQYPLTPVTSSYYLPSLAPGKSANIYFQVSVDTDGNPGSYPITIYESWRQPNGAQQQTYSGSNPYYAIVSQQSGSSSAGPAEDIVVAAVVVLAAVLYMRRSKRSKQVMSAQKKK